VKHAEVELALMEFIRDEFLWGDDDRELTESTPLLEWGIIDSLRTALLLAHMREKLGVFVSPAKINARNFRDVTSIAALVVAEAAVAADTTEREPA
jgi:clorobiocin biosynthesis protein CloN5